MKPLSVVGRVSRSALLALAVLFLAVPSAHATKLKQQNLTQLIRDADSIIGGVVKDVHDGVDDKGVPYTQVTISVGTSAKGRIAAEKDYTFRQFGLLQPRTLPNGHKLLAMTPEAFPRWREGEYVVAFLFRPAARTGLQTTVGLAQGKLSMVNRTLVNDFGNSGLFEGVKIDDALLTGEEKAMLKSSGPVDLDTFLGLVNRAVDNQWVEKGGMK
ncbi:hypothetical protein [Cognatilysobacter tabacisoli]|uniref:hypothetical protein n=1 Tax=Cognatilysobacter tabacisoli TaxID=2315424 RepID=UPI000E6B303B|nr:hypothetical protein [Lysobacter tabacisoli]